MRLLRYIIVLHVHPRQSPFPPSCGGVYTGGPVDPSHPSGNLGPLTPDSTGRIALQVTSQQLKVYDLIGRSVVIHETQSDGTTRR